MVNFIRWIFPSSRKSSRLWALCGFPLSSINMKCKPRALRNISTWPPATSVLMFVWRPVCILLKAFNRRVQLLWNRIHHSWTQQEWKRILFSDESRFNSQSDCRRVFIWGERGARYHPFYVREIDRFGGKNIFVWSGIRLGRHTPQHVFNANTANAHR